MAVLLPESRHSLLGVIQWPIRKRSLSNVNRNISTYSTNNRRWYVEYFNQHIRKCSSYRVVGSFVFFLRIVFRPLIYVFRMTAPPLPYPQSKMGGWLAVPPGMCNQAWCPNPSSIFFIEATSLWCWKLSFSWRHEILNRLIFLCSSQPDPMPII